MATQAPPETQGHQVYLLHCHDRGKRRIDAKSSPFHLIYGWMPPYRVDMRSTKRYAPSEQHTHVLCTHTRKSHLRVPGLDVELLAKALHEHGFGSLRPLRAPAVVVLRGKGEERHL